MSNLKHVNYRQLRAATPKPHASHRSALIAFVIVASLLFAFVFLCSYFATPETKPKADNSNNNNTANYTKVQKPTMDAVAVRTLNSSTLEIVTINSNNNDNNNNKFAKNSLPQRATAAVKQQQQHHPLNQIIKVDSENSISASANATDSDISMAAAHPPNVAAALRAAGAVHNGFDDKINISNQRNEFNERRQTTATAAAATPAATPIATATPTTLPQRSSTKHSTVTTTTTTTTMPHYGAFSSNFERIEQPPSAATRTGTRTRPASTVDARPDKHQQKLLLHRQKRYLVFPEGSSFQLVFDLIIPIVDYTNYAIMGITCAVAWELPSKPPSEILENFRDKLNDGTYGLTRRNDSISNTNAGIKYVNNAHSELAAPATVASIDTGTANYGNVAKPPPPLPLPLPPATSSYYNNYPSSSIAHQPHDYAPSTSYYMPAAAPAPYTYRPPADYFNAKQNFNFNDPSRRPTFVATNNYPLHTANGTDEQQKFADWPGPKWQHWSQYGNKAPVRPEQTQYAGAYEDNNWWQRNRQRVQDSWQSKQRHWHKYADGATQNRQPVTAYAAPSSELNGRTRRILQQPPPHRVYPVFGHRRHRRRRRRQSEQPEPADAVELKLEAIHLREQLQTRQKLYGKIEKLYKVRGYNGTACVLRALCETGQRQHQRQPQPQTFVAELLRAVFSLPPASRRSSSRQLKRDEEELKDADAAEAHVAPHYRDAHAHTGNCAQLFALCQHSIWR